jgi:hypothetical protein
MVTFEVRGLVAVGIALVLSTGCLATTAGTLGPPSKPLVEFPSPQALAELAKQSPPDLAPSPTEGEVPAGGWSVDSAEVAAATPEEAWQPSDPWEGAFQSAVGQAKPTARITRALSCVARQFGRFRLETSADPPADLVRFVAGACGVTVPWVESRWFSPGVENAATDPRLFEREAHQINAGLLSNLPAGTTEVGFWFGRGHGRAVAVMTSATALVRWKQLSLVADQSGDVVLAGEYTQPVNHFAAYVNHGRFGVEACPIDPGVSRPRFRIVCSMGHGDPTDWVQLYAVAPHRVLFTPFAQILVRRDGGSPLAFPASATVEIRQVSSSDELTGAILEHLNRVRVAARLAPVRLSMAESATAKGVTGAFFGAAFARGERDTPANQTRMDDIALGLLAGWQVEGTIREGFFVSSHAPRTRDAGRWLESALTLPFGRVTLLSAEADEIAIGSQVLPGSRGLAALVTAYRHFTANDHRADVERLYERLALARARRHLARPVRLGGMDEVMRTELRFVEDGRASPAAVLNTVLQDGTSRFGAGMRGYTLECTDLDALEIPEDFINRPNLFMEIAVSHHRPPGAAWGQFVILVVYADDPRIDT